jgi:ADP-ribose pyrophosphatase YjhB (NUDIX family)
MSDRESRTSRVVEAVETVLRRRASPAQLRVAYRLGYLALRPWWFVTRPRTRGVKAVVRCGDEVLLVRHTYARRGEWDTPGGFLRPDEDPRPALGRELAEELGVTPARVTALGVAPSRFDHKREELFLYVADVDSRAFCASVAEIAEAEWFAHDALPPRTGRFARRLVARAYWEYWTHLPDDA